MILLEPALHSIDILLRLGERTTVPLVPFCVSGEYAQLTHADHLQASDYAELLHERLALFKRCGASMIVSYAAKEAPQFLHGPPPRPTIPLARQHEAA